MHSALQVRTQVAEEERARAVASEVVCREQNQAAAKEIASLRQELEARASQLLEAHGSAQAAREASTLLEVERELRARSEMREESERRERIAACAQLLATQTECQSRLKDFEARLEKERDACNHELAVVVSQRDAFEQESKKQADQCTGLVSEMRELKRALEHAEANHECAEQLGRVTGEMEVLKRRLKEALDTRVVEGSAAADKVRVLEEQLRVGEQQRRRMHNLIQELRGNIRVFARVRPFLPSDSVPGSADGSLEPVITVINDGAGLRITRKAESGSGRPEDHGFTFDKVFGPSSSQVSNSCNEPFDDGIDVVDALRKVCLKKCLSSYSLLWTGTMSVCSATDKRAVERRIR